MCIRDRSSTAKTGSGRAKAAAESAIATAANRSAVSYTHLDVYKRQVLSRSQLATPAEMDSTVNYLNHTLEQNGCARRFGADVLRKNWEDLTCLLYTSVTWKKWNKNSG